MNSFYLTRGYAVVEIMVLLVVQNVLFQTVPDLRQDWLVNLYVVLFILVVSLKDLIDRALCNYLIISLDLTKIAQTHRYTCLLDSLTYYQRNYGNQAFLYDQIYE